MSDNDDLDIEDGGAPESSATFKKKSGLAAILPTILKFAAIGIAAVIFITTVTAITVRVMRPEGRAQTVTDPMSPFVGALPMLTWFDVGTITTQTRDTPPHTVTVVMHLAHDPGDTVTSGELHSRRIPLQAFARRYFASRFAEELRPENEARLRLDIRNIINDRYLNQARIRDVDFVRLDVMETF